MTQSDEDKELKEKIDGHCERLLQNDLASLKELKNIVKSATTAMTSVPKPFKFLKTHYGALTELFKSLPDSQEKVYFKACSSNLPTFYQSFR